MTKQPFILEKAAWRYFNQHNIPLKDFQIWRSFFLKVSEINGEYEHRGCLTV